MLALNCRYMQSKWIRSTLHSMTGIHASHGNPPHAKFKLGNMLAHDLWKHCLEFTMNVGCYVAHVALGCLHCIRHTVTANSFSLYVHSKQTASPLLPLPSHREFPFKQRSYLSDFLLDKESSSTLINPHSKIHCTIIDLNLNLG